MKAHIFKSSSLVNKFQQQQFVKSDYFSAEAFVKISYWFAAVAVCKKWPIYSSSSWKNMTDLHYSSSSLLKVTIYSSSFFKKVIDF